MGKVIVNCLNRPEDEDIDCGQFGLLKNMQTHENPGVEGTVVIGFPLPEEPPAPAPAKSTKSTTKEEVE